MVLTVIALKRAANGLAFCIAILLLCNCTSLSVKVPGPLVLPPELTSKGKGGLGVVAADEYTPEFSFTPDASRRPPDLTRPTLQTSTAINARAAYGFADWIEASLRIQPFASAEFWNGLGLTVQMMAIGDSNSEGFRLSPFVGAMRSSTSISGDQNGLFGPGGFRWNASAVATTLTAGLSLGYRLTGTSSLIYTAFSVASHNVDGSIEHSPADNGSDSGANYNLNSTRGSSTSAALGAMFGDKVRLVLELRHNQSVFENTIWSKTDSGLENGQSQQLTLGVMFR